jgi:hypothetical protein
MKDKRPIKYIVITKTKHAALKDRKHKRTAPRYGKQTPLNW